MSELRFEFMEIPVSEKGEPSSVPDISRVLEGEGNLSCSLDENDEIYENYGRVATAFPYRAYHCYHRECRRKKVRIAILENDFLRAEFLIEYGGRLWKLIDKVTGENLLYTNDVIRPSNLATRNAWFSGGTEWNISIIGHSPFTMEPVFVAQLEDDEHNPVLRMYEYERIRRVTYQMDFWLGAEDTFLNCRMRIVNPNSEVIPMYWWSNTAVPQYPGGRIVVPAAEAYTNDASGVHKTGIPIVDGVDISRYEEIPLQTDYFFNIPAGEPKFLAHVNRKGYGLLHLSTERLQSRKLFSWGNNEASAHWQEWLTDKAGPYVEVQGGLGKTQYGCIPMAPHTAWEWLEQYGPIRIEESAVSQPYEKLRDVVQYRVETEADQRKPDTVLCRTRQMAKRSARLVQTGNGAGVLENLCRQKRGEKPLEEHLDFGETQTEQEEWVQLLQKNRFPDPEPDCRPRDYTNEDTIFEALQKFCKKKKNKNWYSCYQLGVIYLCRGQYEPAQEWLEKSLDIRKNPWAYHALSIIEAQKKNQKKSIKYIRRGLAMCGEDLSYIRDAYKILLHAKGYEALLEDYAQRPKNLAGEARLQLDQALALNQIGESEKAYQLLGGGDFVLDDLKEGEDSLEKLWTELHEKVYHEKVRAPYNYQFNTQIKQ